MHIQFCLGKPARQQEQVITRKKKKSEFGLQQEHPKSYNEVTRHPIEIHLNLTSLKNQSILSGEKKHIETASKLV